MFKQKNTIYFLIFLSNIPFLWLITQASLVGGTRNAIGNIVGLVGANFFLWQLVLGNRFILQKLNADYIARTKIHIFMGTFGTIFVILHPILQMLAYNQTVGFIFFPQGDLSSDFVRHVAFGRLSFYLFAFIWFMSAILRRFELVKYRVWIYTHYLAYPMILLVFLHARDIGTFVSTVPAISLYWNAMTATLFGLFAWRVASWFNIGKARYRLVSKVNLSSDIVQYFFEPASKAIKPEVGQFAFLRSSFFSESHPFTVLSTDENTGNLSFAIKREGKYTSSLEKLSKGSTVFLDGPYGVFTSQGHNKEPKIIFAGGIGVTPFVGMVEKYPENTYMFYSNRTIKDAVMRKLFRKQLGNRYVELFSRSSNVPTGAIKGRIDKNAVLSNLDNNVLKKANIFVCGSKSFMNSVQEILSEIGVSKKKVFMEEFSI